MSRKRSPAGLLLGIAGIMAWRFFNPAVKQQAWESRDDLADAAAKAQQRRQRRVQQEMAAIRDSSSDPWVKILLGPSLAPGEASDRHPASAPPDSLPHELGQFQIDPVQRAVSPTEPDAPWREALVHPAVVLILGKRGSGKSALAYRLLELFRYRLTPYVVGAPDPARRLLPDWIGMAPSLDAVPAKSIVLVDEAYLRYHARESQARQSREMSRLLNLSRQREQTLIFVTQEARQVDRNIASSASVVVFKEPGSLQLEFERRELRRIAEQARVAFAAVGKDRTRWSHVFSPDADFSGMIENALPSFWSRKLGRIFAAGQGGETARSPSRITPAERRARANDLRAQGWSYAQIAKALGVSKATAVNYVRGYRYQRVRRRPNGGI